MTSLPVASAQEVRAHARRLVLRHPRELALTLALHGLAAASGLAGPWLLGSLVEDLRHGIDDIARVTLLVGVFILLQAALTTLAVYSSAALGERVLAELREEFVRNVLALPLGTVERAGSGDLVTRMTRDVGTLSLTVRRGVPDTLISIVTITVTAGGLIFVGPLLALPSLIAVPILWAATRWWLARARDGYLRENASYSQLTEGLTETVDGARTVEALRLGARRFERVNRDIAASYVAERYTLRLRTVYLPIVDTTFLIPVAATLVIGGLFYIHGLATLAAVTAATLYTQQLIEPADRLLAWMKELQVGGASLARLLGVASPDGARAGVAARPGARREVADENLSVRGVSFGYREGRDVLHDVNLEIGAGERVAIVGPSGAGKSTLGRLLAGIHPPRTGAITVGGVPLIDLPPGELRGQVALVTQEHHVFRGTLADNLLLARRTASAAELESALRSVEAWEWVSALGLDARVGSGAADLSAGQAQQLALARLVLANPHTLVLDEATSLLDPRAARHLERSLAAVLEGRTVIAISHRLHTAHDAGRVVVLEDGRITELGTHAELIARNGGYAALWASWHGQSASLGEGGGSSAGEQARCD